MKHYFLIIMILAHMSSFMYAEDLKKYKYIPIDNLAKNPSEYIGNNIYIECQMNRYTYIRERSDGRYTMRAQCRKKNGYMQSGSKSKRDISIITTNKNINKVEPIKYSGLKFKAYGTLMWSDSYTFGSKALLYTKWIEIDKSFYKFLKSLEDLDEGN